MKSNFFKNKRLWFYIGIGAIAIIIIGGVIIGATLSIDYSIVNKLRHYTMTSRSNDMFNPKIVQTSNNMLIIEITYETLNYIPLAPDEFDPSDVWITFGRCPKPIVSQNDWTLFGEYISDVYLNGINYDAFCDTVVGNYYTHFYYEWTGLPDLEEGYVYALYVDFIDGTNFFHYCPDVYQLVYGEGFEFEIAPFNRASIFGDQDDFHVNVAEIDITNCDFISFFEYQMSDGSETTTVTYTPTPTYPTSPPTSSTSGPEDNNYNDGIWNPGDNLFNNIAEQFEFSPAKTTTLIILFILLLVVLIIGIVLLILYLSKKIRK